MSTRFQPQFDSLSQVMLALSFGIGFFSLAFQPSPGEQFFFVFYLLMGVVGIALGVLFAGGKIRSDKSLSSQELRNMLVYIMLSSVMVYFMATAAAYVPTGASYPQILSKADNLIIGVSEELFFSFFLFAWLVNNLGALAGNLLSAGLFALFHTPALGFAVGALLVVFAAKVVMNFAFYLGDGRIAIPMGAHIIYNVLVMGL